MTKQSKTILWQSFLDRCTPKLWGVRILSADPMQEPIVRTTIGMPDDRDIAAELARRGIAPGTYKASPLARTRGESLEVERRRLRMTVGQRLPSGLVTVSPVLADAPPSPRTPVGATVDEARRRAETARLRAQEEEELTRQEQARADRARLRGPDHSVLEGLMPLLTRLLPSSSPTPSPAPAPSTDLRDLVAMMAEQQRQTAQLLERLTSASAPAAGNGLAAIVGAVKMVQELRGLLTPAPAVIAAPAGGSGDDDDETDDGALAGGGELATVLREFRALLDVAGRSPTRSSAAAPKKAASGKPGSDRVQALVRAMVQESVIGSDAVDAADRLRDLALACPVDIREPLLDGRWGDAWNACGQFIPSADWQRIDNELRTPRVAAWLSEFSNAMRDGDDGDDDDDGDDGDGDAGDDGEGEAA